MFPDEEFYKFTKKELVELVKMYFINMFILDTMLNDISNTNLKDIHKWLDSLNNDLDLFIKKTNKNVLGRTSNNNLTDFDIQQGCVQMGLFTEENKNEDNIG